MFTFFFFLFWMASPCFVVVWFSSLSHTQLKIQLIYKMKLPVGTGTGDTFYLFSFAVLRAATISHHPPPTPGFLFFFFLIFELTSWFWLKAKPLAIFHTVLLTDSGIGPGAWGLEPEGVSNLEFGAKLTPRPSMIVVADGFPGFRFVCFFGSLYVYVCLCPSVSLCV